MKTNFTKTWTKILATLLIICFYPISRSFGWAGQIAVMNNDLWLSISNVIALLAYSGFIGTMGAYIWVEGWWGKLSRCKDHLIELYEEGNIQKVFWHRTFHKFIKVQAKTIDELTQDNQMLREKNKIYFNTIRANKNHHDQLLGKIKELTVERDWAQELSTECSDKLKTLIHKTAKHNKTCPTAKLVRKIKAKSKKNG